MTARAARSLRFVVLPGELAVVRLAPRDPVPDWAWGALSSGAFASVTRTGDELSIVCDPRHAPRDARIERGFTAIQLVGPFAFDQVGILSSFTGPLAQAGVSVFATSTFDTDYVLVKADRLDDAVAALVRAGHAREGA